MKRKSAQKLWQSDDEGLHPLVEAYTVGDDYMTDRLLLPYDIAASRAHACMLKEMGILSAKELSLAEKGLSEIGRLFEKGAFVITREQEDGHTAIEQYLTEHYGTVGKKIHTGRSRNDQSLVMLRLYMKEKLARIDMLARALEKTFRAKARVERSPMPGYTHLQKAMPTTVAAWLTLFADAIADARISLAAARTITDQNPLGSASGFGIRTFPLKRSITTKLLGFKKTQENPLYCGISRGYFETIALASLGNLMFISGRFASDMLLFTTQEFGFFSLPKRFTSGSSIMPQKRNYDLFEIMRGNVKIFRGYEAQIRQIVEGMSSNYHRDLQLTKKPFVESVLLAERTLELLITLIPELVVNEAALAAALTPDLYATEEVYALVKKGANFRDAYREVKKRLSQD